MMINIKKQKGFTLIEVMITVAIIAILVAVAVPSFSRMIKTSRVESTKNLVLSSFQRARLEAMSRGKSVALCVSDGAGDCLSDLSDQGQWGKGWLMFIDKDRDGRVDSDEKVVASYAPSQKMGIYTGSVVSGANRGYIRFAPTGRAYGGLSTSKSSPARTVCIVDKTFVRTEYSYKWVREISISILGRITDKTAETELIANDDSDNNCAKSSDNGICQTNDCLEDLD